jgi:hypothetical protein
VKEDGPDGGHVNMDILSRSVRHRLRDLMDDVSILPCRSPQRDMFPQLSSVLRPL